MATRSFIGLLNDDGTVSGTYCHFDGYPSGVGRTLKDFYTTQESVEALLGRGGISVLGETPDSTRFYTDAPKDRLSYASLDDMIAHVWRDTHAEYAYVYSGGAWSTYGRVD